MLRRRGLDRLKEGKKRDYHRDCRMPQAEIIVIMLCSTPQTTDVSNQVISWSHQEMLIAASH